MKIAFVGDYFSANKAIVDKSLSDADITCVNLEAPLTERTISINKAGPAIRGNKANFLDFVSMFEGDLFFNLANNHIGDYGEHGIEDTVNAIKQTKSFYSGVSIGGDIPGVVIEDKKVAFVSVCERQFGISQLDKLGAAPFSFSIYSKIKKLKDLGLFVIVASHFAEEMNQWMPPKIRDFFKSLVDAGADIVYNTHSHVPNGFEEYNGGVILYGMGNFIFNRSFWAKYKYATKSVMYIWENGSVSHKWIEFDENNVVRPTEPINGYMEDCVYPLKDDKKLIALWQEYSIRKYTQTYEKWMCPNIARRLKCVLRAVLKKDFKYAGRSGNLLKYHLWSCESHRQVIETALGVLSGELRDYRNEFSKKMLDKYYQ
ncbi:MAG: CapA family protein [Opitutales bacterium]|nr:CapA family protein [Opitutales bacterium]